MFLLVLDANKTSYTVFTVAIDVHDCMESISRASSVEIDFGAVAQILRKFLLKESDYLFDKMSNEWLIINNACSMSNSKISCYNILWATHENYAHKRFTHKIYGVCVCVLF